MDDLERILAIIAMIIACAKKLFGNDYRAVGRMNKALEMAVVQTKLERMTMDDVLLTEETENDTV